MGYLGRPQKELLVKLSCYIMSWCSWLALGVYFCFLASYQLKPDIC